MELKARIARILADTARIDPGLLRDEVELSALNIDSILVVEALFAIEEAFDIALPVDLGPDALTFAHLCNVVEAQLRDQG